MKALVICLIIIAIAASYPVGALSTEQQASDGVSDAYIFPLRPGMPEWKELKSHAEMLAACQIPEELLAKMSTEGLVRTCLNYPMAYDAFAYDSFQTGLKSVIASFNGLQELITRPNVGSVLLRAYKDMDPLNLPDCGYTARNVCRFQFMYIELLLAEDAVIAGMGANDRRALLEESYRKYVSKRSDSTYALIELGPSAFLMSTILLTDGFEPYRAMSEENEELRTFIEGGLLRSGPVLKDIADSVEQFLVKPLEKEGQ